MTSDSRAARQGGLHRMRTMASTSDSLPTDLAAAHAMIIAQREALIVAQAKAQNAEAEARHRALLIEQMKFTIAKLRHEKFGQSAERGVLLEQLEFRLADMEEDASEAETKAQVPVQAKGKTRTGRLWAYVRDDQPFGGLDPPAAAFFYSPDRGGEHPERHLASYSGLMQADAYAGFNRLYEAARKPGPIIEAACWAHGRRKFFDLARLQKAPIAIEAIERIDALFAIEREINGLSAGQRRAVRNERSRPLVAELESWLRQQRAKLSRKSETAKAIDYSLKRWTALIRFLDDGRLCMSNNAAERAVRCIAVGRKNWTFAGSDEGGHRAGAIYTLIETAKLNDIDPQTWLADVLARLPDYPAKRIADLLPWNWRPQNLAAEAA